MFVTGNLFKNKDFKKRFDKLFWNMHIKPDEFVKKWEFIINEFNLEVKRWFNDMFELHDKWIPTYFNDTRMNFFFNTYSQSGNLLLNFMMDYDTTIQKQRNTQMELDHETKNVVNKFISPRSIEKHAAKVHTSTLFYEVQKEIYKGSWYCHYKHVGSKNEWELYKVEQLDKNNDLKKELEVEIKFLENDVKCTCEHFKHFTTLCRNAFNILMKLGVKEIPDDYIENCWRKDVIPRHCQFAYNFEACLEYVRKKIENGFFFLKKTESMLKEYGYDLTNELQNNMRNIEEVGKLMGVSIPENIEINIQNV
uniref:Protein FAR1-RELATED SEQUENCE n=1 Tax=Lactuca sativa TaxID=4236 RepID=A0A9R1VC24_LACSA|nr:hypothetical protein LSAT_V11C500249200 [Lactuca sativa]